MKIRLDIESLRALKAVASTGSVTRAAVKLNLTQSAVSHKIKRLEERIGRPVFARSDGSLGVTEDGAHLLNYAERLVGVHDEAVALFSRNELAGHVRLGVTEDVTGSGIARVLARYSMVYPNVSLVSRVAHSLILGNQLRRGEIDLALMQLFEHDLVEEDRLLWWDDVVWVQSEDFEEAGDGSLPFIVSILVPLTTPGYRLPLSETPIGMFWLGVALLLMATGIFIMNRMIQFDF